MDDTRVEILTNTQKEEQLLATISLIKEMLNRDGGDIELLDYDTAHGHVTVLFTGACVGCGAAAESSAAVERVLLTRLPWLTKVFVDSDEYLRYD